MSVYCAAVECKYNGNRNQCTAKQVTLSWHSVMTVWEGRQEFCQCRTYEMSDEAKEMRDIIKRMVEGEDNG